MMTDERLVGGQATAFCFFCGRPGLEGYFYLGNLGAFCRRLRCGTRSVRLLIRTLLYDDLHIEGRFR